MNWQRLNKLKSTERVVFFIEEFNGRDWDMVGNYELTTDLILTKVELHNLRLATKLVRGD